MDFVQTRVAKKLNFLCLNSSLIYLQRQFLSGFIILIHMFTDIGLRMLNLLFRMQQYPIHIEL